MIGSFLIVEETAETFRNIHKKTPTLESLF